MKIIFSAALSGFTGGLIVGLLVGRPGPPGPRGPGGPGGPQGAMGPMGPAAPDPHRVIGQGYPAQQIYRDRPPFEPVPPKKHS